MADHTTLTREGLALVMWDRIAASEGLWSGIPGSKLKVERGAALDLLGEVIAALDGRRVGGGKPKSKDVVGDPTSHANKLA